MFVTNRCCYLFVTSKRCFVIVISRRWVFVTNRCCHLLLVSVVSLLLQSDVVVTNKPRYSSSDKPMQMLVPASFSAFLLISCWSFFTSYTMVVK